MRTATGSPSFGAPAIPGGCPPIAGAGTRISDINEACDGPIDVTATLDAAAAGSGPEPAEVLA